MLFAVVVFPGSNCDHDCHYVIEKCINKKVEYVWYEEKDLSGIDCVILPGGFSYGDYLRAGAIARFSPVMEAIKEFAAKGGLILGICNGFQILVEAGLLPGAMMRNKNLKFICEFTYIRVENPKTPFTCLMKKGEVLKIPIAHIDGNYFADEKSLKEMKENNQIIFRYSSKEGIVSLDYNPNGSVENIAGICNKNKNVLGMMPHPERCCEAILGSEDGKKLFSSIIAYLSG